MQSKSLGSALSSVWSVPASYVDSSRMLLSLGEFLWFNYLLGDGILASCFSLGLCIL